ncbi:MAG: diguanylate cyclase (GGDEF)-like protein [Alphaproteobacteria bacterium]|jgi:diguanylate cyclase (GGDEF)-like protein
MKINANAPDKILSLLLEIAKCSFVRVTEFKRNGHIRHQFGELEHALIVDEPINQENSHFVEEQILHFGDYQFNISILSPKHTHIECTILFEPDTFSVNPDISNQKLITLEPSNRKPTLSISANSALTIIELVHHQALPKFIIQLRSHLANEALTQSPEAEPLEKQQKGLTSLLLQTMSVTIESLQLVNHYKQLTSDSLTKLHSRTALQAGIDEKIQHSSMVLCMVHCIDFQNVNRKFGQANGDTVLHEIAGVIEKNTRKEDICGRFRGALFGIAINANSAEDGFILANKLQTALHNKVYLQNVIRLTFNIGIAFVSQEEDKIDAGSASSLLIHRSEQALKAAQNTSNPTIVQWEPDKFRLDQQEFNYLGGIFTPDNVTNYRNMLLLWDITSIIADEHTFERLLKSVVERLAFTFEFAYAGIVNIGDTGDKTTLAQQQEHPSISKNYSFELQNATEIIDLEWATHPYQDLVFTAAKLALENSQHTEYQEDGLNSLVIPLGNDTNECFFIMGHNELLDLTHDTVMLFVGFARQLGKASKRSQLEDQLNKNLEQQNAKLSQELLELKTGMQSSALVYRSAKMQRIVEQTQRAAQTDATVLITGESGTGKEKLINAIHLLSPRNKSPLVIVDCGSIPETLIESELFGHIKGAFAGSQSSSTGKIQAADGGILVLDEIGELPIAMQPKLLRFAQEKQYTPVGGNKPVAVDVKIVAVTNRDLTFEVSQGKFRKDLFYRLNVVSLHSPPLRERIEDIDLLCQHFLSKFSLQFEMGKKRLSQETIELMRQYAWPGNIRELENKLMQASLLTIGDEIQFADLNLDPAETVHTKQARILQSGSQLQHHEQISQSHSGHEQFAPMQIASSNSHMPAHFAQGTAEKFTEVLSENEWCMQFSQSIGNLLASLNMHTMLSVSIGNSIDLVLLNMAQKECHSHAKTAVLLQLPISTARRRLQKPMPNLVMFDNDVTWQALVDLLEQIVSSQVQLNGPVEVIRNLIAQNILELHSTNMALASKLMGVSEPTMYKLRKQLQSHP